MVFFLSFAVWLMAQQTGTSPHGKDFKISCSECHSSQGWKLDKTIYSFNHNATAFPLSGQHESTNCRLCHSTLVFKEAKTACVDCHTDLHAQTVGPDCGRCHTPKSWIVENITDMHQRSRFPLLGPHYMADCFACHPSASLLRFDPQGIECYDCHFTDYNATTKPSHVQSGYSKNCTDCHLVTSFTWATSNVDHSFFPLTAGHDINDCSQCHSNGTFSGLSKECNTCHMPNYTATTNPNHQAANIPTSCGDCHTTNPGWKPAEYLAHDNLYFPVYSGKHVNTWNTCIDCHTSPGNYQVYTCTDCHAHLQPDMDSKHNNVGGYLYNSVACFDCHPQGSAEGGFNHNTSIFPLTGAHTTTPCASCHINGYSGTPTACSDCHINNYNQTTNPNHITLNLAITCATCHSTAPGWKPASFPDHNTYYPLTGAHATIANDCAACHNGNYNSTPNTCAGCHQNDYNQTTNPPHASAQFPTNCEMCHTQTAWDPSTFNHDGQYFPIYSGKHNGEWSLCSDCHTNPSNYSVFSCIDCHAHNQTSMNDAHSDVPGYTYNSLACYQCHPTGSAGGGMLKPRKTRQQQDRKE